MGLDVGTLVGNFIYHNSFHRRGLSGVLEATCVHFHLCVHDKDE
jgi:hypothetical protein